MGSSIWEGITLENNDSGGGGEKITTDLSVPGGEYVGECVEFFQWYDKTKRWFKLKFAFTISSGPHTGKHLVRWSNAGGTTGEGQAKNRKRLASDFMLTLGRLPEFSPEEGLANQEQVRSGIIGSVCRLKADAWIGDKGQPMLTVWINDTIRHGGAQLEEHDPFRDAGEPTEAHDPFAIPPPSDGDFHSASQKSGSGAPSADDEFGEDVPF